MPFDIPDLHHFRVAVGWLELGNHLEADAELDNITPALRAHPDVLGIRWLIYAKEKKWDACKDIARAITTQAPARVTGWLHYAYATRRATGGSVQAAFDIGDPKHLKLMALDDKDLEPLWLDIAEI